MEFQDDRNSLTLDGVKRGLNLVWNHLMERQQCINA